MCNCFFTKNLFTQTKVSCDFSLFVFHLSPCSQYVNILSSLYIFMCKCFLFKSLFLRTLVSFYYSWHISQLSLSLYTSIYFRRSIFWLFTTFLSDYLLFLSIYLLDGQNWNPNPQPYLSRSQPASKWNSYCFLLQEQVKILRW